MHSPRFCLYYPIEFCSINIHKYRKRRESFVLTFDKLLVQVWYNAMYITTFSTNYNQSFSHVERHLVCQIKEASFFFSLRNISSDSDQVPLKHGINTRQIYKISTSK